MRSGMPMPEGVLQGIVSLPAAPRVAEAPAAPAICRLEEVRLRRRGEALLDGLSLSVAEGGVTCLMGPNGAGKSLTLRLIAGLIQPEEGALHLRAQRREVALVFQKPVLLRRSVRANLRHALRLAGVARGARGARLEELLALGRLLALAERPARALSGGEQQRLAIVRALAFTPRLLLLDEPTASLDPQATMAVERLITHAVAAGTTAVLVTHDRGQAARLADQVVFMHAGQAVEAGPAGRLLAAPASPAGRAYLDGRLLV